MDLYRCLLALNDAAGKEDVLQWQSHFCAIWQRRQCVRHRQSEWAPFIASRTGLSCFIITTRCSQKRQTMLPVPPPGKLNEMYASSLTLARLLCYLKALRHPQNRKYMMYCSAVREGPSPTTGNMHRKFGEIWTCFFELRKRTDTESCWWQYFVPPWEWSHSNVFGSGGQMTLR